MPNDPQEPETPIFKWDLFTGARLITEEVARVRHEDQWWATYNSAITGLVQRHRSHDGATIHLEAQGIANTAHGVLV